MAYVRPAILTVGDVVSEAYMTQLRDNAIAYEDHGHTGSNDGAQLTTFDIFGTGADGDVTITGGTTTLTSGKNYDNLTIEASGILETDGFIVRVQGTLTMSSGAIIRNDGANGTGGSGATPGQGGVGGPKGDYPAGGRVGQSGGLGSTGIGANPRVGLGATNEDETATESDSGLGGQFNGSPSTVGHGPGYGGAGGGGGGANSGVDFTRGGGGGGGGGPIDIRAAEFVGTGVIRSKGGNGGSGNTDGARAAGGGGGGGGGWIRIISLIVIPGTITFQPNGGGGGTGASGGSSGGSGSTGRIEKIELSLV